MLSWRTPASTGILGGNSLPRARPALSLPLPCRLLSLEALKSPSSSLDNPIPRKGRQLAPWRQKRESFDVPVSSVVVKTLYARGSPLTERRWKTILSFLETKNIRPLVVTAQMLLLEEPSVLSRLSDRFQRDGLQIKADFHRMWRPRMKMLRTIGITEDHVRHWVWILQGDTADARVSRFLEGNKFKPIFMLNIIVHYKHTILNRQLFLSLLDYVEKTYCQPDPAPTVGRWVRRALDPHLNMAPLHFVELVRRLVTHTVRLCPEAFPRIAEIATAYLKVLARSSDPEKGFSAQCRVFNQSLEAFSRTSYLRPYANIEYNWEAQRLVLAYSTKLRRPLIIDASGYRAIQTVMVARQKSEDEEKVAIRSAKSWPPYREAWDGLDEQRDPQADLSQSVRTSILAREAGYPKVEIDHALSALGGAILDEGPTIQTRALVPPVRQGQNAMENPYLAWAMKIRATRNAQEAWTVFQQVENDEGLVPSSIIYAEMFAKLLAREVTDPDSVVPGTTRETMPTHEPGNLSEFEKWRRDPPTVAELYDRMLRSGLRPVDRVLKLLLLSAESEREAIMYLHDSPFKDFAAAVSDRDASCPPSKKNFFKVVGVYESVPIPVFGAYVSFLCRMQGREYLTFDTHHVVDDAGVSLVSDNSYLQRALAVVAVRLRPDTVQGRVYKPPWYDILRLLIMARTHGALATVARSNLVLFLDIFKWVNRHTGMDVVLLEILCLSVGRVMAATFTITLYHDAAPGEKWWIRARHGARDEGYRKALGRAWIDLMAAFDELRNPGGAIGAYQLYIYLRVLGMYGAVNDIVAVMRWVFAGLKQDSRLKGAADEGSSDHAYMLRALGFVEGYLREVGEVEHAASIRTRRRALVEQDYPFVLSEMSEAEKADILFVKDIAQGWKDVMI